MSDQPSSNERVSDTELAADLHRYRNNKAGSIYRLLSELQQRRHDDGLIEGEYSTFRKCAAADVDALQKRLAATEHEFKNFHRLLSERFGYVHDEKDWKRDQVSLIEWIAKRTAHEPPSQASNELCAQLREGTREYELYDNLMRQAADEIERLLEQLRLANLDALIAEAQERGEYSTKPCVRGNDNCPEGCCSGR